MITNEKETSGELNSKSVRARKVSKATHGIEETRLSMYKQDITTKKQTQAVRILNTVTCKSIQPP